MSPAKKKVPAKATKAPPARDVDVLARQLDRLDASYGTALSENVKLRKALETVTADLEARVAADEKAKTQALARIDAFIEKTQERLVALEEAFSGEARREGIAESLHHIRERVTELERRVHDHEQLSPAERTQ